MTRPALHSAFSIVHSAFSRPRLLLALEFLLYALLTAFMLHATWLTWPDAFIDFSRGLYLPWRVSCGDVLYRDLPYFFGPFSVYVNATLFALLGGPSIHALFALNFVFWGATLLALRAMLRRIASPLAATVAVSSFILLFSFSRYLAIGNYNFLAPYTHELPRGFLLALLSLLTLDSALAPRGLPAAGRVEETLHWRPLLLPGILLGLVAFTKAEVFLAASSAAALRFLLSLSGHRTTLRTIMCPTFVFLAAALVPLLLVPALLSRSMPFPEAIHASLFRPYLDCLDPAIAGSNFYLRVSGMDRPAFHLSQMAAGVILAAIPLALAKLLASPPSTRRLSPSVRLALLSLLCLAAFPLVRLSFWQLNAALPLAPILLLFLSKRLSSPAASPLAVAFAAFAFVLSLKIILNASISFYGFVLILPSFLLTIVLAFSLRASRPVALALLAAFTVHALMLQRTVIHGGRFVPVSAPDAPAAYRTQSNVAAYLNQTLRWISQHLPPGATLAVLPEGAVINVLSGHPNSTPFVYLDGPAYLHFDEADILRAYRNCPPDFLLLVKKEILISDEPRFGIDYAQPLMAFLDANYSPVLTLPVQTPTGIQPFFLLARHTPSP